MNGAENGQENTADAGPPHRPLHPPHRPLNPRLCLGSRRHYTWDVPHDVDGFIALWPSVDAFVEKLQFNMEESTKVGLVRGSLAYLAMFAELTPRTQMGDERMQQGPFFDNNWLPNPYYWQG